MYYVVTEKTRDGEFEYLSTCILKIEEGEEPSEGLFLRKLYGEGELKFDDFTGGWQIDGDYRLINLYNWHKIEAEEHKEILNKYGIH